MFKKKLQQKLLCFGLSAVVAVGNCYVLPSNTVNDTVKAATVKDLEGTKKSYTDENGIKWNAVESNGKLYNLQLVANQAIKPDIVIPSTIQNKTVAGIGTNCMERGDSSIVYTEDRTTYSLTLPPTIERISDYAFNGEKKCTEVKFSEDPNQIVKVGGSAFQNSGVNEEFVEYFVNSGNFDYDIVIFYGCNNLKELDFKFSGTCILTEGMFKSCAKLEKVTITGLTSDSMLRIDEECFKDCIYLDDISF